MPLYTELNAEQQALVDNYNANLRSALGLVGRLVDISETIQAQWNQDINPLGITGDVPNNSGLAGSSVEEAIAQITTWQSYLDTLISTMGSSAHMDQYVSAAGPANVQGSIPGLG